MIYRNSQDPVQLKKIDITVWLLRDELEYIVMAKLKKDPNLKNFDDLFEEFSKKSAPNLRLIKSEDNLASQNEENDQIETNDESTEKNLKNQEDQIQNTESKEQEESLPAKKEIIIQRVPELPTEKKCIGRTFLSEIYMDKMLFFSDKLFTEGQSVVIQFDIPEKFILNAEVTYSQSYSLRNRIISKANLPYRICANFSFLKPGERTLLRNFLEKIEYREIETIIEDENLEQTNTENNQEESEQEETPVESETETENLENTDESDKKESA